MKELRFHPQYHNLLFTTAEDSFSVFRPNLDPDFEEYGEEESKEAEGKLKQIKETDFALESDEDLDAEEQRMQRTARELTR